MNYAGDLSAQTKEDALLPLARTLHELHGRRILLLQGPVGGFFGRLGRGLKSQENYVLKINFNAGDWLFYPNGLSFRGRPEELPSFLQRIMGKNKIDLVLMFSDCRPIHCIARNIARMMNIEVGVFEEGYIRPDFITLERDGVNAFSQLDHLALSDDQITQPMGLRMQNLFLGKAVSAALYFFAGTCGKVFFPHYKHHKAFSISQAFFWARAALRKLLSTKRDKRFMHEIRTNLKDNFYLAVLQVYDDYQIIEHSDYADVEDFISDVIKSFINFAPTDSHLVFKHHPMDRGYRHYGHLIQRLSNHTSAQGRIHYHHDLALPEAIAASRGVIVVNSTVGLDSLFLEKPTCTLGRVFYALKGLTFQGGLDLFWGQATAEKPDRNLFLKLRRSVILNSQINGSFYKKIPHHKGEIFAGLNTRFLDKDTA